MVNIMVDGRPKLRLVHQLVLEAFVGPRPDEAMGVRHLNDDPTDNTLGNLAWGTYGENMQDRVTNGIHHYAKRTHCKHGHEYTPENTKILTGKRTGRVCLTCQRRNRNDRATAEAVTS